MIWREFQEPAGLSPDAKPIADWRPMADHRAAAERGSDKLLRALLKASKPNRRKFRRTGEHTWPVRLKKRAKVKEVQEAAARHFNITLDDLTGPKRGDREMSRRRQVAMAASRLAADASYPDIGHLFNRDHTTVLYACDMIPPCDEDVVAICSIVSV